MGHAILVGYVVLKGLHFVVTLCCCPPPLTTAVEHNSETGDSNSSDGQVTSADRRLATRVRQQTAEPMQRTKSHLLRSDEEAEVRDIKCRVFIGWPAIAYIEDFQMDGWGEIMAIPSM